MFSFSLLYSIGHVFKFRHIGLIFVDNLLCPANPWTLSEDAFHVFCIDDLTCDKQFSQFIMSLFMFFKHLLCTGILVVDHLQNFIVNHLSCGLRIRALELIFLIVVIADVR